MKQIPASVWTLIAGIVVTLISLWVGQNHGLLPEQASLQAPLVDRFFNVMVTIGVALFLVVEGAILVFAIRFRRKQGDNTDGLPIEGSVPLEILWTAIPAVIVVGLGVYSVDVYEQMGGFGPAHHSMTAHHAPMHRGSAIAAPMEAGAVTPDSKTIADARYGIGATPRDEGQTADLVVDVTGLQYAWLFNYPANGIMTGELHVPVGQDVQLNLSAQDVIHSFWVPQFRMKQDVIPGQTTEYRFTATKEGTFPIVCTELCGSYHGSMRTQLVVHSQEGYEEWLAENQVAQTASELTVAASPTEMAPSEFLAPYAHEMGVDAVALSALHNP